MFVTVIVNTTEQSFTSHSGVYIKLLLLLLFVMIWVRVMFGLWLLIRVTVRVMVRDNTIQNLTPIPHKPQNLILLKFHSTSIM